MGLVHHWESQPHDVNYFVADTAQVAASRAALLALGPVPFRLEPILDDGGFLYNRWAHKYHQMLRLVL